MTEAELLDRIAKTLKQEIGLRLTPNIRRHRPSWLRWYYKN